MATKDNDEFRPNSQFEEDDEHSGVSQSSRRKNLAGLVSNGRTRAILLFTGVLIIIVLAIGYHNLTKPKTSDRVGGDVNVNAPPQLNRVPGTSDNATLNKDISQQNIQQSLEAKKSGQSFLPELHGNNDTSRTDPLLIESAPPAASTVTTPSTVQVQSIPVAPVVRQAPVLTPEQQQQLQQEKMAAQAIAQERQAVFNQQMNFYLGRMRDNRQITTAQEFSYNGQKPKEVKSTGELSATTASAASAATAIAKAPALIQAGTIIPSVLITPVNSDSPGPLLVDITSGPFRGGRALCEAQTQNDTVGVHCSRLSLPSTADIPGSGHSFQINAYVVNSDYQTNIATSVNHHTFKNLGWLAASAFVQGYGQAVARTNTTTTNGPFGSTTSYGQLSNSQINKTALGQVGMAISQNLQQRGNIPTTVRADPKYPGAGIPVGLLFMSDF